MFLDFAGLEVCPGSAGDDDGGGLRRGLPDENHLGGRFGEKESGMCLGQAVSVSLLHAHRCFLLWSLVVEHLFELSPGVSQVFFLFLFAFPKGGWKKFLKCKASQLGARFTKLHKPSFAKGKNASCPKTCRILLQTRKKHPNSGTLKRSPNRLRWAKTKT